MVNALQDHFVEEEGSVVTRQAVMEILQLDSSQKALATNAMFEAFPKCLGSRKVTGAERVSVYKNVARKQSFTLSLNEPSLSLEGTSKLQIVSN